MHCNSYEVNISGSLRFLVYNTEDNILQIGK